MMSSNVTLLDGWHFTKIARRRLIKVLYNVNSMKITRGFTFFVVPPLSYVSLCRLMYLYGQSVHWVRDKLKIMWNKLWVECSPTTTKTPRRSKWKWYLLNDHPINNNKRGIETKRKYQRSGKRCCGKICIYCGKLRRYNSNRSLVPGWCVSEEKYKTKYQF